MTNLHFVLKRNKLWVITLTIFVIKLHGLSLMTSPSKEYRSHEMMKNPFLENYSNFFFNFSICNGISKQRGHYQKTYRKLKTTTLDSQRCPTHSPLATCGEWPFKCGEWLHSQILQDCHVLDKILILRTKIRFFNYNSHLSIKI